MSNEEHSKSPGAEDIRRILGNAHKLPSPFPSYPDAVFVKPKQKENTKNSGNQTSGDGVFGSQSSRAQLEREANKRLEEEAKAQQAQDEAYEKELAQHQEQEKDDHVQIRLHNLRWDRPVGYFNKSALVHFDAEIPAGNYNVIQILVKVFSKSANGKREQISNQLINPNMEGNVSKEVYLFYPKERVNGEMPTTGTFYFTAQYGNGIPEESPEIKIQIGVCNDKPPPVPEEKIGTCPYYQWRHQNFISRHDGCNRNPPAYYLGYGYKYCVRFSKETAPMLSAKGKVWLSQARKNLQEAIEIHLYKNQNVELNSDEFTSFAFRTHTKAYWDAGLESIDILDLIRIGYTPDFSEWLDERSRVQAYDIAGKLVQAWTKDVADAVQQRSEATIEYFREILK